MLSGVVTQHQWFDEGKVVYNLHKGWTVSSTHDEYMSIHPDDPLSAKLDITWCELFERDAWEVSSKTRTIITSTSTHFMSKLVWRRDRVRSLYIVKLGLKTFLETIIKSGITA